MVNEGPKLGQSLVEIDRLTRGEGPFVLQFGYLPTAERSGDVAPSPPLPFASLANLSAARGDPCRRSAVRHRPLFHRVLPVDQAPAHLRCL